VSTTLEARGLRVAYDDVVVLDGVDLEIPAGRATGLIGANGSGKSTLLRALARVLRPAGGAVLLDGADIHRLPTRAVARRLGLLPQAPVAPPGMTVEALVALGRHPHRRGFGFLGAADRAAIHAALDRTGLADLAARPVDSLSGGQRQLAWIALALCQETPVILLDEPTTFLDIAHQVEVLEVVERLRDEGRTIVVVLHDLLQAARHCDHLVALVGGRVRARGSPREVLTAETVRDVFGVECSVVPDPCTGQPLVVPHPRVPPAATVRLRRAALPREAGEGS
jgi:iron complex transport system ATP-binding protein